MTSNSMARLPKRAFNGLLGVLAVVALAVLVLALNAAFSARTTQTAGESLEALPRGWKLHVDKETGYSFGYPPDAYLTVRKPGLLHVSIEFNLPGSGSYQGMAIHVLSNLERLPIDRFIADNYKRSSQSVPDDLAAFIKPLTVSGFPAVKIINRVANYEFKVLLPVEDRVYVLAPVSKSVETAVLSDTMKVFEQVLTTFTVKR